MANKNKIRFNGIDVLIIIAFIGCVIALALRYQLVDVIKNSGNDNNARISFRVEDIQEESEQYFNNGDKFFVVEAGNSKILLGTLENRIDAEPAEVYNFDSEGNYVLSSKDGRIDVRGEVIASGLFSEEGFLLNNTKYLAPGSEITIQSNNIEVTATVLDITEITE
jgi:hypothetical protein